jgi:hypothetical protein
MLLSARACLLVCVFVAGIAERAGSIAALMALHEIWTMHALMRRFMSGGRPSFFFLPPSLCNGIVVF